jgi:hypothetical protein
VELWVLVSTREFQCLNHVANSKAPGLLSDADDTARTILTLTLLDFEIDSKAMMDKFESRSCFKTYIGERDPSFSANCNILNALLHVSDRVLYRDQIIKILIFICKLWDAGLVKDKWVCILSFPFG